MAEKNKREYLVNISESVVNAIDVFAKGLVYLGGLAAFVGIGLLLFTILRGADMDDARIVANIQLANTPAILGLLGVSIGVAWLMWGEEIAGPILVIIGLALFFLPGYAGYAIGPNELVKVRQAIDALSKSGGSPIVIGLIMIVGDLIQRIRQRAMEGARAELMKYGQGVREEKDIKNVFLGKCWQLPYCRKYVRERCPIYHSKRTCWKEKVGCMCEEQVIRNAMAEITIPKDIVAASKMIPRNPTLTPAQKKQRCVSCVIYNEHQKHKYKALIPVVVLSVFMLSLVGFAGATTAIKSGLLGVTTTVKEATTTKTAPEDPTKQLDSYGQPGGTYKSPDVAGLDGQIPYAAIIYFTCVLVAMAYAVRVMEFLIFKHKI